jgi:hypothetical protein
MGRICEETEYNVETSMDSLNYRQNNLKSYPFGAAHRTLLLCLMTVHVEVYFHKRFYSILLQIVPYARQFLYV